jgi:hypothetical protein
LLDSNLMAVHAAHASRIQRIPKAADSWRTEVAKVTAQFRVVLLVLAVLRLAAVGDPVKRCCPIELDCAAAEIGFHRRIAYVGN